MIDTRSDLTEDEMRLALFGTLGTSTASEALQNEKGGKVATDKYQKTEPRAEKKLSPTLIVKLRVGNEFEGRTEEFVYKANTLSHLQAEIDAKKAARKKFKYVELVSVS